MSDYLITTYKITVQTKLQMIKYIAMM